jgi:hypothetical protein
MHRTCKFANPLGTAIVLTLFQLVLPVLGQSEDEVPAGFKPDRYQRVWQRNPFTLVTPVVAQAQPSLFDKLILLSWLNDGGNDVVFVQNTETNAVQKVTKEPNTDDLKLVEIRVDPDPRKVEVHLSRGAEQGVIKFRPENPVAASQASGSSLAAGGAPTPGAVPGSQPLPGTHGQAPQNTLQSFQQAARTGPAQMQQGGVPSQVDNSFRPPRASEIRRKRVTAPPANEQPVNPQQPNKNPANQPQGQ